MTISATPSIDEIAPAGASVVQPVTILRGKLQPPSVLAANVYDLGVIEPQLPRPAAYRIDQGQSLIITDRANEQCRRQGELQPEHERRMELQVGKVDRFNDLVPMPCLHGPSSIRMDPGHEQCFGGVRPATAPGMGETYVRYLQEAAGRVIFGVLQVASTIGTLTTCSATNHT